MMAKGKWAQGIQPRQFHWIITDKLAICERPGGYGTNHRRVRRQEEVIWIRENGFAFVISLIPSDHNLHSYDELGMPWKHWPFAPGLPLDTALPQIYTELSNLLGSDKKLLLHMEEVGDRMAGFVAGYLRWTEMVPVTFEAITVVERILGRQMGPTGRAIVTAAEEAATSGRWPPPGGPDDGPEGSPEAAESTSGG
ncbi:MAG: hypothetical protein OEV40_16085 [Acidimicrobiia bacterium]|nr:hypothetical protein [Acidimicrobiia bacterium]